MKGWDEVFNAALKQKDTVWTEPIMLSMAKLEAINDFVKQNYRNCGKFQISEYTHHNW